MATTEPASPKGHRGPAGKAPAFLFLYCLYTLTVSSARRVSGQKSVGRTIPKAQTTGARSHLPTCKETVLAVGDDDLLLQPARGAVELTVVFIKPPVGAAHGHVAGLAGLQAPAFGLPRLAAERAPAPTAAQLLPAGGPRPVMVGEPCQAHKRRGQQQALGQVLGFLAGSSRSWRAEAPSACEAKAWGLGCRREPLPSNRKWLRVPRAVSWSGSHQTSPLGGRSRRDDMEVAKCPSPKRCRGVSQAPITHCREGTRGEEELWAGTEAWAGEGEQGVVPGD